MILPIPMAAKSKDPIEPDQSILVNKLTVKDAVHLVKMEGGSLSKGQIVFRVATVLVETGMATDLRVHGTRELLPFASRRV